MDFKKQFKEGLLTKNPVLVQLDRKSVGRERV